MLIVHKKKRSVLWNLGDNDNDVGQYCTHWSDHQLPNCHLFEDQQQQQKQKKTEQKPSDIKIGDHQVIYKSEIDSDRQIRDELMMILLINDDHHD